MEASLQYAIRQKLIGTSAVNNTVNGRVYFQVAPAGASLPFIVFDFTAGGFTNDTPTDMFDVTVMVKAVDDNSADATTLAGSIRDALHKQALTYNDDWKHLQCQYTTPVNVHIFEDGRDYWQRGGNFRVRASKR